MGYGAKWLGRARAATIAVTVTVVAVLALPSATARAQVLECEQVSVEVAAMVAAEPHVGMTADRLDEFNHLIDILVACVTDPDYTGESVDFTVERWRPLVAAFFALEDVERAMCLMSWESAGDPSAVNPSSGASGLMQVMPFWASRHGYPTASLLDPLVNLEVAASIRATQGWDAWSPFNRGLCR